MMKQIIMISGLISALFVGDAFSSRPAPVKRLSWAERVAEIPQNQKPGTVAFNNRDDARRHGVLFDENNNFTVGELVVSTGVAGNGKTVHGDGIQKYGIVQSAGLSNVYVQQESYQGGRQIYAENIGKLPQASSVQSASSRSALPASYASRAAVDPSVSDVVWGLSNSFIKEDLGDPLASILGKIAFSNKDEAQYYGISFDKNNTFARRELVVIRDKSVGGQDGTKLLYGVVLNRKKQLNSWQVQNEIDISLFPVLEEAENIGKMIALPIGEVAPGGPAIQEEEKEEIEGRPHRAEGQIEGPPSYEEAMNK